MHATPPLLVDGARRGDGRFGPVRPSSGSVVCASPASSAKAGEGVSDVSAMFVYAHAQEFHRAKTHDSQVLLRILIATRAP